MPSAVRKKFIVAKVRDEFRTAATQVDVDCIIFSYRYGLTMLETLEIQTAHLSSLQASSLFARDALHD